MKYMITVFVLLLATLAAAEDTRKWYAIAYSYSGNSYGVAWNFPTKGAAETAADAECEKRANKGCRVSKVDYDHCFIILRVARPGMGAGFISSYTYPLSDYDPVSEWKLFQTEEEARRLGTDFARRRSGRQEKWSLDMVACSGDPRNRRASK